MRGVGWRLPASHQQNAREGGIQSSSQIVPWVQVIVKDGRSREPVFVVEIEPGTKGTCILTLAFTRDRTHEGERERGWGAGSGGGI